MCCLRSNNDFEITTVNLSPVSLHRDSLAKSPHWYPHIIGKGRMCLVLLNLSAAFDIVDNQTLQKYLKITLAYPERYWNGLSFVRDRHQSISIRGTQSNDELLKYGVSWGSVLDLELFKDYITPLRSVIEFHDIFPWIYWWRTALYWL